MRLSTLDDGASGRPGAVLPDGRVLDLQTAAAVLGLAAPPPTVRAILAGGHAALAPIERLLAAAEGATADRLVVTGAIRAADSALLAPIPDPRLIVSTSGSYRSHNAEMNAPPPREPSGFVKSSRAVIASGEAIRLPAAQATMVDWEGEFALVIGRPCHNVTPEEAMACVAGYTAFNDVSARDAASSFGGATDPRGAVFAFNRVVFGKQFPTFAPLGPAILTCDEVPDPRELRMETRVNGAIMQSTDVGDTVFTFSQIIAHFAQWFNFLPGDIVTTGTPAGVGFARTPPVFLKPGDVVEVEVDRIGVLRNPVVASDA